MTLTRETERKQARTPGVQLRCTRKVHASPGSHEHTNRKISAGPPGRIVKGQFREMSLVKSPAETELTHKEDELSINQMSLSKVRATFIK